MSSELVDTLRAAAERRRVPPETTAFRVVHGAADRLKDVAIDRFDDVLVVSLYREMSSAEESELADALVSAFAPRAIYLKRRPKEARVVANTRKDELSPAAPLRGERVDELVAQEHGLSFVIRPSQGLNVGLYLDARDARQFVREKTAGKSLLNCFAYTCGFGLFASKGGASEVLNLDISKRVLEWGQANARLNGLHDDARGFLAGDVFEWLRRFAKKARQFDWVVLDPPSFSTTDQHRFSARTDYGQLVDQAARLVSPGGVLMACCNRQGWSASAFEAAVGQGLEAAGRHGERRASFGPSSIDFPPGAELGTALKVLACSLD